MTADRDALLDLLGAVEQADRPHPGGTREAAKRGAEDALAELRAAVNRARRHLDRQRADARAEPPRSPREVALDLAVVTGVHEQSAAFEALVHAVDDLRAEGRERALRPFEELFSGGPDTVGRSTWRENPSSPYCSAASIECVEVPVDDLRAAFEAAGGDLS